MEEPGRGDVPQSDASPFGFSCDNQTTYSLGTYCPQMARAGITWIRGFPTFNVIEPVQGRFDWTAVDRFLGDADRSRMHVSGLFLYSVPWISQDGGTLPTGNLPAWSRYVSAVVRHCKGKVKYWEVWNETPNFIGKGTADDYARTVVAAYDAAKQVDPACRIGLSIQSVNVNWLVQTIQAGAKDHFDFIAVHPYEVLDAVESNGWEAVYMSIVPTLRKMLADRDGPGERADLVHGDRPRGQGRRGAEASALVKAFVMGIAQGVARIDWFEGKDGDSGPMGLLRADGRPRLACPVMSNLTRHLGPCPEYRGWVLLDGKHHGFVFQGACKPSWQPGRGRAPRRASISARSPRSSTRAPAAPRKPSRVS